MWSSTRFPGPVSLAGLLGAAVTVLTLCWSRGQTEARPPRTVKDHGGESGREGRFAGGRWRRGEVLYRQNCASCHGANLAGRCMAPSLRGVTRHLTDEAIVAHARKIGETMCCARHIRRLSDGDFTDIVAYFRAADRDPAVRHRADRTGAGRGCCCSR